jgi:Raf kinase inhibitor-like YbhB/YbcL family protein
MKRHVLPYLAFASFFLFAASALFAQAGRFAVSSSVVRGASQTGFDSGLKSAGRIDSAYAARDKGPGNPRSFPFTWSGAPDGTVALALVMDDPDAKPVLAAFGMTGDSFLHWIVADIDPSLGGLADDASGKNADLAQGKNGAGNIGYAGPQPPSDIPKGAKKPLIHIYRLTLYALSEPTGLSSGFTLDELKAAMEGKVLGTAQLNFAYSNN